MVRSKTAAKGRDRKRPIGRRIGEHFRSIGLLGKELVNHPAELPGMAHGSFRRWFRKVWSVRGGGLYACGFAIAFLILEIRDIVDDVSGFSGIGGFLAQRLFELLIRFAIDSLLNTLYALMWPVYILQLSPPYGAMSLAIALIMFPRYFKKPIERWLFASESEPPRSG